MGGGISSKFLEESESWRQYFLGQHENILCSCLPYLVLMKELELFIPWWLETRE